MWTLSAITQGIIYLQMAILFNVLLVDAGPRRNNNMKEFNTTVQLDVGTLHISFQPNSISNQSKEALETPEEEENCTIEINEGKFIDMGDFIKDTKFDAENESRCQEMCDSNQNCNGAIFQSQCFLLRDPIIYGSATDSLKQCRTKCLRNTKCLVLSYMSLNIRERKIQYCYHYNRTLNNLTTNNLGSRPYTVIGEKTC